jgi:glycosyltransferase involved in cell wall biosynthesis
MMDKFSIVLPVRNGAEYIRNAITSVLSQTYTNFELIILENFSDDGTQEIINEFDDPRIRVCPSSSLLSIEENWRRILKQDLAEFLTILSHDDLFYPDFLTRIMYLIRNKPYASLYQTQFQLIDAKGNLIRSCRPIPRHESGEEFLHARHLYLRDSYGTGYVMRSKDFKRVGGMPMLPRLVFADDILWYRIASLGEKSCDPGFHFAYRFLPQSQARKIDLPDLYMGAQSYLSFLKDIGFLDNPNRSQSARNYVKRAYHGHYHRILVELIESGDPHEIARYKRTRNQLVGISAAQSELNPFDLISRLMELCISSRIPNFLRGPLAGGFRLLGDVTARLRSRPADDL